MLQKAKTHAIPLGNHVTQQKLTENTENRSALTKTPNFGIFRFIPVYSALFGCHSALFRCHSGSFRYIPAPFLFILFHSGIFWFIPAYSVLFLCLVPPTIIKLIQSSQVLKFRKSEMLAGNCTKGTSVLYFL